MQTLTLIYILNAMFLLLHEIESAYEEEWNVLRLPGKISGFLIIHIPIILILMYGLVEISRGTSVGLVLGIVTGVSGLVPFLVHKVLVNRKGKFSLLISNVVIYTNVVLGILLIILSARFL